MVSLVAGDAVACRQHLDDAKERALVQWCATGYRDEAAHDEAARVFALLMWATYASVQLESECQCS